MGSEVGSGWEVGDGDAGEVVQCLPLLDNLTVAYSLLMKSAVQ